MSRSPKFAEWLLRRIFPNGGEYDPVGDFAEVFEQIADKRGLFRACLWYWAQIIFLFNSYVFGKIVWSGIMFKSYLKIALRNIIHQKVYSMINIVGLAVGVACCLVIFLFVQYELSFDTFHSKADRIFRIVQHRQRSSGMEYRGSTPYPMAGAIRDNFMQLEVATQVYWERRVLVSFDENRYGEDHVVFVEPQFLELFDTQWIAGNPENALKDPHSVILTESVAYKYFGTESVLGKVIRLRNRLDVKVTGVVQDPPKNSHLPYRMLVSSEALEAYVNFNYNTWNMNTSQSLCYILLPKNVSAVDLEAQLGSFMEQNRPPETSRIISFHLQPLRDIHFNPRYQSSYYITSKNTLRIFSGIGFFILLLGCINFINLATAQAMKRAKEVGMRKVLGSNRAQLIRQFMGETTFFTFIAILFALFLVELIVPHLNQFLGNDLRLSLFQNGIVFVFLASLTLFVCILTGLYPAFILSRFQPVDALRNKLPIRKQGSLFLRNGLVVFQFIISQILVICSLVIGGQMDYFRNRDLGFRKDGILSVPLPTYDRGKGEMMRNRWLQNPQIKNVGFALGAPTSNNIMFTSLVPEGSGDQTRFYVGEKPVDHHYLEIFEIPLIAGRFFRPHAGEDSDIQYVVNETLTKRMGLIHPQDAVGRFVSVSGGGRGEIIGVVEDFHSRSLHEEIDPLIFYTHLPQYISEAEIQIQVQNIPQTLDHIRDVWTNTFPENIFQYRFLDDLLETNYANEAQMLQMIRVFATIAIIIGCLGLLGLVSFMIVQRTKEIGIRKVLGASAGGVVLLMSREFMKWILLANVIAWPVAYFAMKQWLQNFAYRIGLGVAFFVAAGVIAFGIGLLIISFQVIRAALSNPVDSLRYE